MSDILAKMRQRMEEKKNWKPRIYETCPKCNQPTCWQCTCIRDGEPVCTDCYNTREVHDPCNCV